MKINMKIKSIILLLARLRNKKQVRPEEISKVLTKSQLVELEECLRTQRVLMGIKRPIAIQNYAEMVRIGCLYYAKMEKYHLPPLNPILSKKFSDKAESTFENALEYIREQISFNGELQIWLDRDFRDVRGLCPVSIPRVIGSGNAECLIRNKQPYGKLLKREVLIQSLEQALEVIQDHTLEQFMTDLTPALAYSGEIRNFDFSDFKF